MLIDIASLVEETVQNGADEANMADYGKPEAPARPRMIYDRGVTYCDAKLDLLPINKSVLRRMPVSPNANVHPKTCTNFQAGH
ncbi:hypothetical protein GWI33_018646 [Rhynchophorus ferrugineus]|uniref:Uncharacterized protein n=1 Tax=Rhynchophorus ferrugineus TaxID=354439 RepID=A0A834M7T4_RHYFE|nr:hypothetical protein GWI33_018646 [Rhynchophorus ferrugineus]